MSFDVIQELTRQVRDLQAKNVALEAENRELVFAARSDWVPEAYKEAGNRFSLRDHLARARVWSENTCGPGMRTHGILKHITKEIEEILADPTDLEEWIDIVILAFDGAWRAGYSSDQIIATLIWKQDKNEKRQWPDWRTVPEGTPIEHVR